MDLEKLKKLADEATPGPWTVRVGDDGPWDIGIETVAESPREGEGLTELSVVYPEPKTGRLTTCYDLLTKNDRANLEFIAAARDAIPTLVAEVERLRIVESAAKHVAALYRTGVDSVIRMAVDDLDRRLAD